MFSIVVVETWLPTLHTEYAIAVYLQQKWSWQQFFSHFFALSFSILWEEKEGEKSWKAYFTH